MLHSAAHVVAETEADGIEVIRVVELQCHRAPVFGQADEATLLVHAFLPLLAGNARFQDCPCDVSIRAPRRR